MRFEAQIIRSSLPDFASFVCSSEPLPDSETFVRNTFGSPDGGPLGAGFGVGDVAAAGAAASLEPLGFVAAAVAGPDAIAGGAPAAVVSSDGRNALANSIPPGRPACSGPLWMLVSY